MAAVPSPDSVATFPLVLIVESIFLMDVMLIGTKDLTFFLHTGQSGDLCWEIVIAQSLQTQRWPQGITMVFFSLEMQMTHWLADSEQS